MKKHERATISAIPIVLLIGAVLAAVGSSGGAQAGGRPVFALCVALAFGIQVLCALPFYILRTEKFFDLVGSITHISVALMALILSSKYDPRSILLVVLTVIWAGRLGTFLFLRVLAAGADDRWDDLKKSFLRFLLAWLLQGLWVSFTQAASIAAITSQNTVAIGLLGIIGAALWGIGFGIEALADWQKSRFRAQRQNQERFITTGLWSRSRHPNYFGEILLWVGMALIALPALSGLQYLTLISPIFVYLLLMHISGVPLLEAKAEKKWGGDPAYEAYKATTPVLFPRL